MTGKSMLRRAQILHFYPLDGVGGRLDEINVSFLHRWSVRDRLFAGPLVQVAHYTA